MKNLRLINMLLVSHREKKAKKLEFHPELTIIQGENDTGKSSIIKTIFNTFGANPHKLHRNWVSADVSVLIRFELDLQAYSIYRHRNSFSLFDCEDAKLGTYSSVTNELGPALAKLFDFKLKLSDRNGQSTTPPPAFLLLPFYIDQDNGWGNTWCSFKDLGQFAYWKRPVIGYHFGLKPDAWYALEAKKKKLNQDKEEPTQQLNSLDSLKKRTLKQLSSVDFDIDIQAFKAQISALLEKCQEIKFLETKYKTELTEFTTEKIRLEAQIEIVVHTRDELNSDYNFACNHAEHLVDCPTCGAAYNNSFGERFSIAQDSETCIDLLASLRDDLEETLRKIQKKSDSIRNLIDDQKEVNELLAERQGNIRLKDIIDIEGKKSLMAHLEKEVVLFSDLITNTDLEVLKITEKMEKYDDPEHRKRIVRQYGEILRKNCFKLSVHSLNENAFNKIDASIEESGSDLPRAILAYYFTSLELIRENGNSTFFPMIIDAPNQQEQDPENLEKILKFIVESRPVGKQLIVGLVSDAGVKVEGRIVKLETKYSALESTQYERVYAELKPFEDSNLAINNESD